ncbi:phage tail protein [Amycolatopsis sp. WGS_07]|uniref:phage tail protein n=1 Tax=Amycolatopsis sp. WGS_07 TaxID=3076764 RepID=UPI003872B6E5
MTCGQAPATFRLLDAYSGWDEQEVHDLAGFADPAGVRLARPRPGPSRAELLPWFPDSRLAPGCQPCSWYLLLPERRELLRRDTCGAWTPVRLGCDRTPVSVAARAHRLAVVDDGRVRVWRREGEQLAGVIEISRPSLAALGPRDEVLVAREDSTDLWRFGSDGSPRGVLQTGVPGRIIGLRTGPHRTIWLLAEDSDGLQIYRGGAHRPFETSTIDKLAALRPSTLIAADDVGFCLRENGEDGVQTTCWTWQGELRTEPPPEAVQYLTAGSYVSALIDSGISRCRWHGVRVEAEIPVGTAVSLDLVVTEDGQFADSDWQTAPPGVTDFLVQQPPGRYLKLRLRLSGDGRKTPVVRRVRLDFPRSTSADLLPPAFRQDPAADDFTERFLSLFDASLAEIDRVIERYPALLDHAGVPDRVLPWLAGLLGLSFEAGWDARTRRELVAAAPELYRRRGTPWALKKAVTIVFGAEPVLDELAKDRRWAQVRAAATGSGPGLGSVRLFGRSSSRFRIGGSALGGAPLRAFGDPDDDPLTAHAHRFRVLLPAGAADEEAVRRLVERQAPAHTRASVRIGGRGFVVGAQSAVGVDTAFVPLPPPVLGRGLRLNHDGVLRPGRAGPRHAVRPGVTAAVGVHTQVF